MTSVKTNVSYLFLHRHLKASLLSLFLIYPNQNVVLEKIHHRSFHDECNRDILIQKRVSLSHTPDIVRVFQKCQQQQEQHEFQKV